MSDVLDLVALFVFLILVSGLAYRRHHLDPDPTLPHPPPGLMELSWGVQQVRLCLGPTRLRFGRLSSELPVSR